MLAARWRFRSALRRAGTTKNASPRRRWNALRWKHRRAGIQSADRSAKWEYVWKETAKRLLRIHVNAEVTAPAAPLATLGVTANGFTQAQITGLFNSLFAGQSVTATVGENVQTKDEIKVQLDRMKQALEDGTYAEDGFSREEYEKANKEQEEAYRNAR